MSKNIPKNISDYIDVAIERERKIFKKEMKHEIGAALEEFQSRLTLMGETIDLTVRETAREVIREEVMPILNRMEMGMNLFKEEMSVSRKELEFLRLNMNNHEGRITRLERASA